MKYLRVETVLGDNGLFEHQIKEGRRRFSVELLEVLETFERNRFEQDQD